MAKGEKKSKGTKAKQAKSGKTSKRPDRQGAYAGFGGSVGHTFADSEGWWPDRVVPPEGAPNIVFVMVDDLGFADVGCYGSEIPTPNIDALAGSGIRFTDYHSTPMCSPTRASLLTGLNSHHAGAGTVAHVDPGFPGYASELREDTATMAEVLRDNGYTTLMVGKWHLAKDSDCNAAGSKHSWPCQRGFERFYGILDAFTNLHHPHRLVEDNHLVEVDQYPDGYYLTDDLTDHAIKMLQESKASNPDKPFFLYFPHPAVHAPLQAPADLIEKHRGKYDHGWDRLRDERFARQQELGIVEPGTRLAPRNTEANHEVQPWDELTDRERELFARHMEVFAAMVESVDTSVGRLVQALDELGERDNTLFIFTSDNGASREGELVGTTAYYVHLLQGDDVDADYERLELIGGPQTTSHYPRGWAMAGNSPFRLYKINTHQGGHSVPFVVSWPRSIRETGALRRQYAHVTDIFPTVLDLLGVERPANPDGSAMPPLVGTTLMPAFAAADAPGAHTEQLFEMNGHRGFYRDGWEVVTLHQPYTPFNHEEWELYDLSSDPTELEDLAARHPEKVSALASAWEQAAWNEGVFPLDDGTALKYLTRPERDSVYGDPVTIRNGTPTLERWRSVQLIWFRSFTIDVQLEYQAGDQGILVAHGDQGAGYALYVLDGELWFVHNDGRGHLRTLSGGQIPPGTDRVRASLIAPSRQVWNVTLFVGDEARASLEDVPLLFGMAPFEGIDVGIDRRSPVSWELYERFGPFPYTGILHGVTYAPGESAPDAPVHMLDMLRQIGSKYE